MSIKGTYQRNRASLWIIMLSLLLSVFTITSSISEPQPKTTQTEFVWTRSRISISSVHYSNLVRATQVVRYLLHTPEQWKNVLWNYNKVLLVSYRTLTKQLYTYSMVCAFIVQKIIPQSENEETSSFLIG